MCHATKKKHVKNSRHIQAHIKTNERMFMAPLDNKDFCVLTSCVSRISEVSSDQSRGRYRTSVVTERPSSFRTKILTVLKVRLGWLIKVGFFPCGNQANHTLWRVIIRLRLTPMLCCVGAIVVLCGNEDYP